MPVITYLTFLFTCVLLQSSSENDKTLQQISYLKTKLCSRRGGRCVQKPTECFPANHVQPNFPLWLEVVQYYDENLGRKYKTINISCNINYLYRSKVNKEQK